MRAAIYARKSTDDPLHASVARQTEHAREFAKQRGLSVLDKHEYTDDGVSGAEFRNRPGLKRLLDDAALEPRPFDVVVTAEPSRLGRERLQTEQVGRKLYEEGIGLIYHLTGEEEHLDTPAGRFMLAARSLGAEIERESGRQRTRDAMRAKAQRGHVTGGVVYGYRNVPVHAGTDSSGNRLRSHVRREPVPDEAAVVRAIFSAYVDGFGLRKIARAMNGDPGVADIAQRYFEGRRVPPPRRGSGSWDPSTVRSILRRDLYRGEVVWGRHRNVDRDGRTRCRVRQRESDLIRVEVPELRIIPEELWLAVQQRHRPQGSRGTTRGYTSASIVSGLSICGVCEGPFTIAGSRKRVRCYGCSWHRNRGTTACPNALLESVSVVDRRLLEEIERKVLTPDAQRFVLDSAEQAFCADTENVAKRRTQCRDALAKLAREMQHLVRAIELGQAPAALLARLSEREQEQRALEADLGRLERLARVSTPQIRWLRRSLEQGLARFQAVLSSDLTGARRAMQQILADRIRFTPVDLPNGARTYRFVAHLALDRVTSLVAQNSVDVPDGI